MDLSFEQLLVTVDERIATVTLNRPDRYNAIGAKMVDELRDALEEIERAEDVRAVILTGAGERAFCSGVDLKERREMSEDDRWAHNRALNDFSNRLARLQMPAVAAINGLAFGGGFEMTLACDFRIGAEHAELALPEVGIGIIPGSGGTQRLPRLIGPSRAKELVLTARRIDADTAFRMGILNRVVSGEALIEEARALAFEIARNSPLAVAYGKAAVDTAMETSIEQGFRFETSAIRATLASDGYREGLASFAEKREPEFPPLTARRMT